MITPLRSWRRALAVAALAGGALVATNALHAYALIGGSWPTGPINMTLQLDATATASTTFPLSDGSTSWNSVAQRAMADWNNYLGSFGRSTFASTASTSTTTQYGDGISSIFFAKTIYGSAFDQYTLAVTIVDHYDTDGRDSVRSTEADLIVNSNRTWDSYNGSVRSSPMDFHRVVLHELGHVLGLDHPDQASPVQVVSAIMNSAVSNLYTLQTDDINGIRYLYGATLITPTITTQPANVTTAVGSATTFTIVVNGSAPPAAQTALSSYIWYFKAAGASTYERLNVDNAGTLSFGTVQALDAGSYYVQIVSPDVNKTVQSNPATLAVSSISTTASAMLRNVSTRGMASSSNPMIAGFVITGTKPKQVLLRAVGPTLGAFGVGGTLSDPTVSLVNNKTGATLATSAAGTWDSGSDAATIINVSNSVGAFALKAASNDAVILTTVAPGQYTAITTSKSGNTTGGLVLLEAYDADAVRDPTSRVVNLSTRGYVGTGASIMIAGFYVDGPGPHTYLLRLNGASLAAAPFNVTGTLIDPILTLFRSNADGSSTQIRVNDDWDSPAAIQSALNTSFSQAGAFGWTYPSTVNGVRDDTAMQSAMIVTLQPGGYTVQATGNANDGTTAVTGNSLIEIYELP